MQNPPGCNQREKAEEDGSGNGRGKINRCIARNRPGDVAKEEPQTIDERGPYQPAQGDVEGAALTGADVADGEHGAGGEQGGKLRGCTIKIAGGIAGGV